MGVALPLKRMVIGLNGDKVKVAVVDDHRITRSFFETTVRSAEGYELAASFAFAEEAMEYCRKHSVDLLILDVLMQSGIDGLTAAEQIKKEKPQLKIILVTSTAESKWLQQARDIGAEAFWYKDYAVSPLIEVMNRVAAGERVFPDETAQVRIGNALKWELTDRELDVLRELTVCATNEEIAENLQISVNTVKTHIRHLLEKTGFSDRLELAINASKRSIVVSDRERIRGE